MLLFVLQNPFAVLNSGSNSPRYYFVAYILSQRLLKKFINTSKLNQDLIQTLSTETGLNNFPTLCGLQQTAWCNVPNLSSLWVTQTLTPIQDLSKGHNWLIASFFAFFQLCHIHCLFYFVEKTKRCKGKHVLMYLYVNVSVYVYFIFFMLEDEVKEMKEDLAESI